MYRIQLLVAALALLRLTAAPGAEDSEPTADVRADINALSAEVREGTKELEALAAKIEGLAPDGWKNAGRVESYVVANLYDKINGRSELFMSYDVLGLVFVSVVRNETPDQFIDVYLYDMKTVAGAFGIFSVERWPGSPSIDIGRGGSILDNDLLFWKGRYYVAVTISEDTPELRAARETIARRLATDLPDINETPWGLETLPKEGLIADSVQFFMVDALALDFMTNTFTAQYRSGALETTVFLSRQETPEKAHENLEKYAGYLNAYGSGPERNEEEGMHVLVGGIGGGYFDAVFVRGRHLAGVTNVQGRDEALRAVREFAKRLRLTD